MPLNPNIPLSGVPVQMPNFLGMAQQGIQMKSALEGLRARRENIAIEKEKKTQIGELMSRKPTNLQEQKAQVMSVYNIDPAQGEKLGDMYLKQNTESREKGKRDLGIVGPLAKQFRSQPLEEQHAQFPQFLNYLQQQGVALPQSFSEAGMNPEAGKMLVFGL